jgi:cytochrome P450
VVWLEGERHAQLSTIVVQPLTLTALVEVRSQIEAEATGVVERLVEQEVFDAAGEFAHHLPVTVVSKFVGIPEEGRERMVEWASAIFNQLAR